MKPRTVIIGIVVGVVLLWLFAAWGAGMLPMQSELPTGSRPVFEQRTADQVEAVARCLGRDYSAGLPLQRARAPASTTTAVRLRNRLMHVVVDVAADRGGGSLVRVFKLNGAPLADVHRVAVQSCIPENRFPPPGDPRNRDFYRDPVSPH